MVTKDKKRSRDQDENDVSKEKDLRGQKNSRRALKGKEVLSSDSFEYNSISSVSFRELD